MNLADAILGVSLLSSIITVTLLLRNTKAWRNETRNTRTRLSKVEEDVRRVTKKAFAPKPPQPEPVRPTPPLLINRPDSIELIRQYISFYHPTLIDDITKQTGERPSSTDELLCMMIKLKYANKEIGTILSITNSSVLTARYRLKRKLGLPQSEHLDRWIQNVGTNPP